VGRQGLVWSQHAPLVFDNLIGALVRNSRADEGAGVFLSVRGASANIRLRNNDLDAARKSLELENKALEKAVAVQN
jgi:hypothetical protein